MAETRETLRLLRAIRIAIDEHVDDATEDLVRAWARAWDALAEDWQAAIAELQAIRDDGKWPTRAQIRKAERVEKALFATRQALDDLAQHAGIRILESVPDVVAAAGNYLEVIASQYPAAAGPQTTITASLSRADQAQIEAIVRRTTESVVSLLRPLTPEAYGALYRSLVRGVALGQNPRSVAAALLRRLEGRFNGGLTRALVIARTEMLDAHRHAAMAEHSANAKVLAGWRWIAELDARTCPSCWAQHGGFHELTEFGPDDHQQGRCVRMPVTKPWSELGFGDIEEPPSLVVDAQDVFATLSRAEQLQVMGAERLRLLDSGEISWADLTQRRTTSGWRDSWGVTPISQLV